MSVGRGSDNSHTVGYSKSTLTVIHWWSLYNNRSGQIKHAKKNIMRFLLA